MWEISIIKEVEGGYIVMAPNGDTQFIDYETYLKIKSKE
jgi:hypothetical protein